ncbi:hypothetical protein DICPUDRAFT_151749 [Dictyostelium purpureum]|uniref:Uncharacterized protein n=1 Tax=Dictyostelium purpureum TaxID=5786 RepID=F0ZJN9_DICPU|nr:uncharacterized protein DICPUDRAFT_151749 [Dictyostelium purpureum]EGC35837.1 hypothetical protein DICPUDRAFT_151749 [Dictyostelium purpureum]|eukprot:XP_003287626.1 hypothetical protein DICPUDRAFT_151749 [Dictyostelium purpureum]
MDASQKKRSSLKEIDASYTIFNEIEPLSCECSPTRIYFGVSSHAPINFNLLFYGSDSSSNY